MDVGFFLEEKKKDCLKMMPAPLFPSGLLCRALAVHVAFCALGGFFEARVFGSGGEKCVAEVCVLFIEVCGGS